MIPQHIKEIDGYWYLTAIIHCDLREYRKKIPPEPLVFPPLEGEELWLNEPPLDELDDDDEELWEERDDRTGQWDYTILGGYCEDILREHLEHLKATT